MNEGIVGPIVSAEWLMAQLGNPTLRVLDTRWYLSGRNGRDEFAKGHLPTAVFVDMDEALSQKEGPGRHPIPSQARFEAAMRRAGLNNDSVVIAYDDAGGSIAARLWWLLRYYGHSNVAVLDGGIAAWQSAGGALTVDETVIAAGQFSAQTPMRDVVVDKSMVRDAVLSGSALLLDARAKERYRGDLEPVDARPGHIPGARSAPWAENMENGVFKSADALRERYRSLGVENASSVIVYCGSGVTACHDLLAMELAGLPGARLYEGSWSDWARDASLDAATGDS